MSSSYKTAGRRFANRFSSLRKARMPCSGAQRPLELVVLPDASRPHDHRVRLLGERECRFGQRTAARFVTCAAEGRFFELESFVQSFEDLDCLGHDLGAARLDVAIR
jgi:hypothetical protein